MKSNTEWYGVLGLAARAGALAVGESACLRAIRLGQVKLVLIATDAGANGAKKMHDKCAYYHVKVIQALSKDEIGRAIGKDWRTVVGVTQEGFAHRLGQVLMDMMEVKAFD